MSCRGLTVLSPQYWIRSVCQHAWLGFVVVFGYGGFHACMTSAVLRERMLRKANDDTYVPKVWWREAERVCAAVRPPSAYSAP